jgi:D-alanyl-D-alanine dipeptidase
MSEPAGALWCGRYPTSTSISDLVEPFRGNVLEFISALEAQGARVTVSATYRPVERAYLMHYACMIAQGQMPPDAVPPMEGVDIQWDLGDPMATRTAASDMTKGYGIVYPAALVSRHTQRRAVDMMITSFHLTGQALWDMGRGFGIIKLVSDAPHWSDDGH